MDYLALQARLPRRPYCAGDLRKGIKIRPLARALTMRHIQLNPPAMCGFLTFDIDRRDIRGAWYDANLPAPTFEALNTKNRHGHLIYALETPVCTSDAGRRAPLRYLAAIQAAYTAALRADPAYAGLISKNPWHYGWLTTRIGGMYSLGYLAEFVELKRAPAAHNATGFGRNCTLFDQVRSWAYQWVLTYQKNGATMTQWRAAVLAQAEAGNGFSTPLPSSEVKAIAKSVSKWVWQRFSAEGFSAVQSARGKRGNMVRWGVGQSVESRKPWTAMEISRRTYYRRRKSGILVSI
jgi:hypothetical protein